MTSLVQVTMELCAQIADIEAARYRRSLDLLTSPETRACAANRMGGAEGVARRIREQAAKLQALASGAKAPDRSGGVSPLSPAAPHSIQPGK